MLYIAVKNGSVSIINVICEYLMASLMEQYGLILPDHFKISINFIAKEIIDVNIFNFIHNKYKDLLTIDTYNNIMYEAAYHNNIELFKLASDMGNNWDHSYYDATRCGNEKIIRYIEQKFPTISDCSFQHCVMNTVKDISSDLKK